MEFADVERVVRRRDILLKECCAELGLEQSSLVEIVVTYDVEHLYFTICHNIEIVVVGRHPVVAQVAQVDGEERLALTLGVL